MPCGQSWLLGLVAGPSAVAPWVGSAVAYGQQAVIPTHKGSLLGSGLSIQKLLYAYSNTSILISHNRYT